MKNWSLPAAVAVAVVLLVSAIDLPAAMGIVEHTFIVSQVNMTHLCKETLVTVVNGMLPGPAIEVTEGDSVAVHVVNKSPYNITIHWHGVKQRLNCWADGVPMVTQLPILPNHNLTYLFDVIGQEGTLWWHAHVPCLRATVHGALIVRPRNGTSSYPFPKPDMEVPIIVGEWWDVDLSLVARNMTDNYFDDDPTASTINGKLGDLYDCSGAVEDGYVLDVQPGKTYLLRLINAALFSEHYVKIAGHKFTVVASDANYLSPYTTHVIAIAPGETVDALVVANACPGKYYMVAWPNQPPEPNRQFPLRVTRGVVKYSNDQSPDNDTLLLSSSCDAKKDDAPEAPEMPDPNDTITSFYFHGNLTSLHHPRIPPVPELVDERLFITLGLGSVCRKGQFCKRSGSDESITVATMNNVSFHLPDEATTSLLEAHYYHTDVMNAVQELPDRPPRMFNFTDGSLIPFGPKEARFEATSKATVVRRFRQGAAVEVVFQGTAVMHGDSNPMHLHGHDMFVLAQGRGNYNATKDIARYNLVNPPVKNTVVVPYLGWVAVRFLADNPGVWYMHCHYEFHLSMGMAALFIVEDGTTVDTSLPPPPKDFLTCNHDECVMPLELHTET